MVGGADVGGGEVVGGALVGGLVAGTDEGRAGTVGSGAGGGGGGGTVVNTTSFVGTVVAGEVKEVVAGGAGALVVGVKTGAAVDGGSVAEVVVVVAPESATGEGVGPAPAACRSSGVGMVASVGGTVTGVREEVASPCVRLGSRETPAQTSPTEMVPTTRNTSAFHRVVLFVPCHQSRSRSNAPGRPNGALFPMACPER